jgi:hypothetical protein
VIQPPKNKKLNCGFVHIPRTGGSSIRKALGNYSYLGDKGGHLAVADLLQDQGMKPALTGAGDSQGSLQVYFNIFWFAFVRNPWDRFVSSYTYLKAQPDTEPGRPFNELIKPFRTFKDFVMNIDGPHVKNTLGVIAKSRGDSFSRCQRLATTNLFDHFAPQYLFIKDRHETEVLDFVGKFENLQKDFNVVCKKIGVPACTLPLTNTSNHKPYQAYYDDESRRVIEQEYNRDIKELGYSYDSNSQKQAN